LNSGNPQPQPHDCYGNPFLLQFPAAVRAKVEWAITGNIDANELLAKVLSGEYAEFLGEAEVEIFLYPHPKKLEAAEEIFQVLTEVVAILAFCPGGIEMFGYHFEAKSGHLEIEQVFPASAPFI
jgi:hypothetical protein